MYWANYWSHIGEDKEKAENEREIRNDGRVTCTTMQICKSDVFKLLSELLSSVVLRDYPITSTCLTGAPLFLQVRLYFPLYNERERISNQYLVGVELERENLGFHAIYVLFSLNMKVDEASIGYELIFESNFYSTPTQEVPPGYEPIKSPSNRAFSLKLMRYNGLPPFLS